MALRVIKLMNALTRVIPPMPGALGPMLGAFSSSADGLGVGYANQDPPSQGAWFLRLK